MTRSFFDTNVLVYLFDEDEPEKKARARDVFEKEAGSGRAVLSTQVLQEFYVNAISKLTPPLSSEVAGERARDFSKLSLVRVEAAMILSAIALSRAYALSFWDALIVESALKGGADRLLTEDLQHGQVIEGLRIENPFL